jgi:Type IV secretion-system coupling protein DNA-binding domain
MPSVHEQLSGQFYKWESRGRGWQVFDGPVWPEPPFQPFHGYRLPDPAAIDDGRRPTFLSSLFRKISQPPTPVVAEEPEAKPEPTPLVRESLVEFQATLPADLDIARESFGPFFHNLALCREPIAFELLGIHKKVWAQFAASQADAPPLRRQLAAHFPDVQFRQLEGALDQAWDASAGDEAFAVELGLEKEFMLPLATGKMDPFVGLIGALAELQPGELALFQILWQPVQNPWAESLVNCVTLPDGKPLFVNAAGLAGAAENKAAQPLYAAVVRIMGRTSTRARLEEIARDMAGSLHVFSNPEGNALIPLNYAGYPYEEHLEDVLRRQSRRSGMILTGDELTGFVHLPASAVRSPVLVRDAGRTKAAPDIAQKKEGVVIGDNEHNGTTVPVCLTDAQRLRHTHIIGSSGTGKSSLLFNLIRQDIENGEGVGVLDPHGDLIDQILGIIPDGRIDDVVLVDPSDIEFPIGFNILSAHTDEEKALLASDLIALFRRLATSWGDQMDTVLQNAILAFLNSRKGGTLSDLRLFLLDTKGTGFQKQFLETVTDPEVVFFWQNVFPQLTGNKSIGPVLTRLQDFFSRKPLRNMVGQEKNRLDFADIMDSRKIFLARLPEGCGEENSQLLGTLLVSKFQQLAMARQSQAAADRQKFWLYIDEFDHFITPTMAKILSGVRKYGLGLTLAHQNLHQLQGDDKVASAVLTQPCTRIVFKVGDDDAKKLGEGFESFDAKSLKNLPKYQAIARVEQNDCDFNLVLRKPEFPDAAAAQARRDEVVAASRAKYARPRTEVEAEILARIWGGKISPPPDGPGGSPAPQAPPAPPPPPAPVSVPPPQAVLPPTQEKVLPVVAEVAPATDLGQESKPAVLPAAMASAPPPPPKPATTENKAPKPGRGYDWHKTTQKRIKTEGEKLGFSAELEKQLAKGSMQAADVVLRRGHVHIAVEIASTSSNINHEFENIHKCLKAGFSHVVAIASDSRFLQGLEAAVQGALGPELAAKVGYHTPVQFIEELRRLAAASELPPPAQPLAAREVRGGFEIERTFPPASPGTQQAIHDIVTRAITAPDKP